MIKRLLSKISNRLNPNRIVIGPRVSTPEFDNMSLKAPGEKRDLTVDLSVVDQDMLSWQAPLTSEAVQATSVSSTPAMVTQVSDSATDPASSLIPPIVPMVISSQTRLPGDPPEPRRSSRWLVVASFISAIRRLRQLATRSNIPPEPPEDTPQAKSSGGDPPKPRRTFRQWMRVYGHYVVYAVLFLFYSALIVIGYRARIGSGIRWDILATVMATCHLVEAIRVVGEKEQGVLILFGFILEPLESGPVFAPWPMRVTKATKNQIKVDFGTLDLAKPEDRQLVEEAKKSPNWFVEEQSVRINWSDIDTFNLLEEEKKRYENNPLAKAVTTDPHLYFTFRVSNLISLIEEAGGLREVKDLIKDTSITALQVEAGKTFAAKAVKEIDEISERIRKKVERLVWDPQAVARAVAEGEIPGRSWGVDIIEVRVKDVGTGKTINQALADRSAKISVADGERTAKILTATGERIRLTEEGQGRAAAKIVEADAEEKRLTKEGTGRAAAAKAIAQVAETPGGTLVLKLEAWEAGMKHGKVVLMPANMDLMSSLLSAQAALEGVKGSTKSTEAQKGNP